MIRLAWAGARQRLAGQLAVAVSAMLGSALVVVAASLFQTGILAPDAPGADRTPAIAAARTPVIVIGAVFGGIVFVVLATVVSATVALAVRQRGRELGLLRALGATGRQASRLIVGETLLAGGTAAVAGLALGWLLTWGIYQVMTGADVVPAALPLRTGAIPFAVALVIVGALLWLAAWIAARPARRAQPLDVLRAADLPPVRLGALRGLLGAVSGAGCVALAVITGVLMPPAVVSATSGPAVLAGGICAALLAPALLRAGLSVCRPLGQVVFGPAMELIGASARARSGQLATVTACVALVVGIGVGNLGAGSIAGGASQGANVQGLVNALLTAVAVAYAAIAVANTVAVSIVSRRREFALLRLAGATTPQVRHALAVEVALAALVGAGAGLVIAAAAVIPTAVTVGRSPATLPVAAILIAALAVVAALVFPVTRYASSRSLSRPPGDVLASEVA